MKVQFVCTALRLNIISIIITKQIDLIDYLYQHGKTAKACCQEMGLSITTHGRFMSGEMQTGSIAYSAWKRYLVQKRKAERVATATAMAARRCREEEAILQYLRANRAAAAAAAAAATTAAIGTTASLQATKDTETEGVASNAATAAIKSCKNAVGLAAKEAIAEYAAMSPSAGTVAVLVLPLPSPSADAVAATQLSNAVPIASATFTSAGPSSSSSTDDGKSYGIKAPVTTA